MNQYTKMQKQFYEQAAAKMAIGNHLEHNRNKDYWDILLGDIKDLEKWENKKALDFGCGSGRNIKNLLELAQWKRVDGCDISEGNVINSRKYLLDQGFDSDKFDVVVTDGVSLSPLKEKYDFIMSTIVLQHICVYEIRFCILEDMYKVLNDKGLLSIQMGFGTEKENTIGYYENFYDAQSTNSKCDTRVEDPNELTKDLAQIGFKNIKYEIRESFSDSHGQWIYVKASKDEDNAY